MSSSYFFGSQDESPLKNEESDIWTSFMGRDSWIPLVTVMIAFILVVGVFSYIMTALINKIRNKWGRAMSDWIKDKVLKIITYLFSLMWIATIFVGFVWPTIDSVVNKGESIDVMDKTKEMYAYLSSEEFRSGLFDLLVNDIGFALLFCLAILILYRFFSILITTLVMGISAVVGGSTIWSIVTSSQELTWESIAFIVLIVIFFILVLTIFSYKITPILSSVSAGSSLVINHLHYILPVVLCATAIFGVQLSIILSLISSIESHKVLILPLIFLLSWSWGSLIYFVKVYTASILEISRSKTLSKKDDQSSIFISALKRTFSALKFILYFSFFPALLDLLIFILDNITRPYKSAKRIIPHTHYIAKGIFKIVEIPMDWIIVPVLNFLRFVLSQIKKAIEYDNEFSLVYIGMYFNESMSVSLTFRKLRITSVKGFLSLLVGSVFRHIFHFGPVMIFTIISIVLKGRATLIALLSGDLGILKNFVGSVFGPLTDIFGFMNIGGNSALTAYAMSVFVIVLMMGCIFSALIFNEFVKKEEQKKNTSGNGMINDRKKDINNKPSEYTVSIGPSSQDKGNKSIKTPVGGHNNARGKSGILKYSSRSKQSRRG
ncbi:uncharacterized protein VICG_01985 [Vittaforma corneae ATCC 50505]|uniref:Uncharacterized protein n=1 Tax=Vittaforma corneae (strain ATCC 50505) TaxID=993615 RepID=L2GKB8_VITCO|nr:uncharacterized protein VICG_01985 [Vittaforma corneae ATCC 50505]ELA40955.1 hypothetical protein VICG_01985 [Vittaforma corneae ATCC 50505]